MSTIVTDNKHYSDIANAIRAKNETNTTYKPSEMALAIKSLQSGGIPCTLTVETGAGAVVTATLDGTTVSATADENGNAIFILSKEGVWSITATLDGETLSTEILIEHKIEEELAFVDPVLANNSWEKISAVARSGKASQYWNVGDTKPMTVAGITYNMQIMDFDMYDVADSTSYGRTKAGIVFQYKEVTDTSDTWGDTKANIDDWITNYSEAKEFIPTIKYPALASYNATTPTIYEAKGISPSEQEVLGTTTYEGIAVGTQYAFYAAGNSAIKSTLSGTKKGWWTRSLNKSNSTSHIFVNTTGKATTSFSGYGSSPVFCL